MLVSPAIVDMVPRQEMLNALAEQRRNLSKENDAQLIQLETMRERLWDLFEAASSVDKFDWSSDGLDEDADAAMSRLQLAVRAIKNGTFPSSPMEAGREWIATYGKEPHGWSRHDFLWVLWDNMSVDCIEAYGSISWSEITHYMPVTAPNPPADWY